MPELKRRAAIFLDRDGVLIEDTGYIRDPDLVLPLLHAFEGLKRLRRMGYLLVVVSNQSGIGRGMISQAEADAVDARFRAAFLEAGVEFAAIYYCPHAPDAGCACRKPAPGLLTRALDEHLIAPELSYMIGDRAADCEAAANAGVKGILLGGDCSSLLEAAAHIEASAAASEAVDDLISVLGQFRAMLPEALACGGMLAQALARGNKILTCGNGGSAAQALHLAEELVGRYNRDRDSLPAVCLSADATVLTCIGNDYGFEAIFSRQVAGLARPGDVLVLFSTSGNSNNLVGAVETAKNKGIASIAFLGKGGGKMRGLAQREIIVPGTATARVQEVHTLILHLLLERIDAQFC